MLKSRIGFSIVLLSLTASTAFAADAPHSAAGSAAHGAAEVAHHLPRPILPDSSPLAGSMLILIAGLFLAAATVGPVVRYHAQEEVPDGSSRDTHGHAAHGHGHGH